MPDPNTDANDLPEVLSGAVGKSLSTGLGTFFGKILGPGLDEVGSYFRDRVVRWRAGRMIYTAERAAKMLATAGLQPKRIHVKAVVSILEGASLEDDPKLSDLWSALLANAATHSVGGRETSFAAILRQLTREDAVVLDACLGVREEVHTDRASWRARLNLFVLPPHPGALEHGPEWEARKVYQDAQDPRLQALATLQAANLAIATENLIRLGLLTDHSAKGYSTQAPVHKTTLGSEAFIRRIDENEMPHLFPYFTVPIANRQNIALSVLGSAFMDACTSPEAGLPASKSLP